MPEERPATALILGAGFSAAAGLPVAGGPPLRTMSAEPAACGPVRAVRLPALRTWTSTAGTPPMISVEPGAKFAPPRALRMLSNAGPSLERRNACSASGSACSDDRHPSIAYCATCPTQRKETFPFPLQPALTAPNSPSYP